MEYDFTKCFPSTISWVLSALSYDEENIESYIRQLFPSFECKFWSRKRGSHFYGIVMDDDNKRCWIVNRGTDGYGFWGKITSWLYDLYIIAGHDGVHNGFGKLAKIVIKAVKRYLYKYEIIYIIGHSQGAGASQQEGNLVAEIDDLSVKHIYCDLFGAPPCFKKIAADRFNRHIDSGKISCDRYVMPQDPIASKRLRNKKRIFLNGVDVGNEIMLPDITPHKMGPAEVINHSCRQQNASYMIHLIITCNQLPVNDIKLLGLINKWIEN